MSPVAPNSLAMARLRATAPHRGVAGLLAAFLASAWAVERFVVWRPLLAWSRRLLGTPARAPAVQAGLVLAVVAALLAIMVLGRRGAPWLTVLRPPALAAMLAGGALASMAAAGYANAILPGFLGGRLLSDADLLAVALVVVALRAVARRGPAGAALFGAVAGAAGAAAVAALLSVLGVAWSLHVCSAGALLSAVVVGVITAMPRPVGHAVAACAGGVAALLGVAIQQMLRGADWDVPPVPYGLTVWTMLCLILLRDMFAVPLSPDDHRPA